ncbi:unnamed protein product [Brachionus calyciflorus]|uniref:G-protein coupled receptors family 1 profile domain-containing protein n=1 Tax=Brachionus calyciflorus TaxID=104777 RepID=A0A813SWX3_9BILA|nr:unnamed protein product [Brachionus calyciflorus]
MDFLLYEILSRILGAYSLMLIILGTIFNFIIFYICSKKPLRNISTFKFLSILALSDTICLYEWNLKHFTVAYFNIAYNFVYLSWCRLELFLQYTFLQYSAWILVSIALDRLLSTLNNNWRNFYTTGNRIYYYLVFLIILLSGINSPILIRMGYYTFKNGTENLNCLATYENDFTLFNTMSGIHLYLFSIVPFISLVIINSKLIYTAVISKRRKIGLTNEAFKKKFDMTKTILILTIQFIVLTLPSSIVSRFFYVIMIQSRIGKIVLFVCDNFSFSFNSFNIITLYLTNKKFKDELKSTFKIKMDRESTSKFINSSSTIKKDFKGVGSNLRTNS